MSSVARAAQAVATGGMSEVGQAITPRYSDTIGSYASLGLTDLMAGKQLGNAAFEATDEALGTGTLNQDYLGRAANIAALAYGAYLAAPALGAGAAGGAGASGGSAAGVGAGAGTGAGAVGAGTSTAGAAAAGQAAGTAATTAITSGTTAGGVMGALGKVASLAKTAAPLIMAGSSALSAYTSSQQKMPDISDYSAPVNTTASQLPSEAAAASGAVTKPIPSAANEVQIKKRILSAMNNQTKTIYTGSQGDLSAPEIGKKRLLGS